MSPASHLICANASFPRASKQTKSSPRIWAAFPRGGYDDDGDGDGGHGGVDRSVGARPPLPALLRGDHPDGPPVACGARCLGAPPLRRTHGRRALLRLIWGHVQPPLRRPHDVRLPRHGPLPPPRGAHHLPRRLRLSHRMVNPLPPPLYLQWGRNRA
jgi:hypothetical protein